MPVLTEIEVLRDVSLRLEREAIDYMLTGSVAMNYYAEPRMTRDIDLVVALESKHADRLRSAFEPDYYVPYAEVLRAIATAGMFNLVHMESVVKIDIIVRKDEHYRRVEFERRAAVDLPGFRAWIVSKEDLILSKLLWAKGSHSELQLRDVRNLLAAGVDETYLRQWAQQLEVSDLLQEVLRERHQP